MKQPVALYARVSSEKQAQEGTIQSQISSMEEYAKQNNFAIEVDLTFIDNGISGTTLERPALDGLRDKALRGEIEKILILCPDRLARKYAHQLILMEEFQRLGVEILFVNHKISESPEDHLLLQVQGVISEYEREKILERSRRGKQHHAKSGKVSVLSGAPYGFLYICRNEVQDARYEIHPEEANVVRKMFDLFVRKKQSIGKIAKILTELEIPTRTNRGAWDRTVIWGMLKNPAYMGEAAYRKTKAVSREKLTKRSFKTSLYPKHVHSSTRVRSQEDWINIPVPQIISNEVFQGAKEQLEENKKLSPRNNSKYEYLLSGLLRCKRCGYALYGKPTSNSRYKRRYYRCIGQDGYRWPEGRICESSPIRTEILDEMVWQKVQQLLQKPESVLQEYTERVNSKNSQELSLEKIVKKKKQELRQQELQKERLLDLYQHGSVELKEVEERLILIRTKMEKTQQECGLLEQEEKNKLQQFQVIEKIEEFCKKMGANLSDLTFEQRKSLVRLLVVEVSVDIKEEKLLVKYSVPIDPKNPSFSLGGVNGQSQGKNSPINKEVKNKLDNSEELSTQKIVPLRWRSHNSSFCLFCNQFLPKRKRSSGLCSIDRYDRSFYFRRIYAVIHFRSLS